MAYHSVTLDGKHIVGLLYALEKMEGKWDVDSNRPHRQEWMNEAKALLEAALVSPSIKLPRMWRDD